MIFKVIILFFLVVILVRRILNTKLRYYLYLFVMATSLSEIMQATCTCKNSVKLKLCFVKFFELSSPWTGIIVLIYNKFFKTRIVELIGKESIFLSFRD